jgi:16S rRNA G966 N2-methylase RsmD
LRASRLLESRGVRVDFVFLDPPYAEAGEYLRALEFLGGTNLVAPAGRIIVEYHRKHPPADPIAGLERARIVEQGDAVLGFYRLVERH